MKINTLPEDNAVMKKSMPACLLLLLFLLSACSGQTENVKEGRTEAAAELSQTMSPQLESAVPTEQTDEEKQIVFLAANVDLWKADKNDWPHGYVYAVTDLDQNGRLEIITSEIHGTGHYVRTVIREMTSDFSTLSICGEGCSTELDILERLAEEGGPQPCGPLIFGHGAYGAYPVSYDADTYPVYYDADADLYHYIYQDDTSPKSDWYALTVKRSFCLKNGVAKGILLSYEADGNGDYQASWNMNGSFVDRETAEAAAEHAYAGLTPLETTILWFDDWVDSEQDLFMDTISESERRELLQCSFDTFRIAEKT